MTTSLLLAFNLVPFLERSTSDPIRSAMLSKQLYSQRSALFRTVRCCSSDGGEIFSRKGCTPSTLLVATRDDDASLKIAEALITGYDVWEPWNVSDFVGDVWRSRRSSVYLWLRTDSMLHHDHVDEAFTQRTGIRLTDLIFVSRHQSSSGNPSLTVHPIGNPGAALQLERCPGRLKSPDS